MDRAGVPPRQGPGMLESVPPLSAFLIGLSALTGLMALELPEATLLAFPGDESVPGGTAVVVGPVTRRRSNAPFYVKNTRGSWNNTGTSVVAYINSRSWRTMMLLNGLRKRSKP